MIKKSIIILALLVTGWLSITFYNNQNPNKEIIEAKTQTANTKIINTDLSESSEKNQGATTKEMLENIKNLAKKYCNSAGVSEVYLSTNYIKVISGIPGQGPSYYPTDGRTPFICPVIAPDLITDDCKQILETAKDKWEIICSN